MNPVWVTGAAGFIGRHLVRHLAATGMQVGGLDLVDAVAAGLDGLTAGWHGGPLSQAGLSELVRTTGVPDTIYHLAGGSAVGASLANPYGDFTATVGGTGMLLDWLREHAPATKLVIVSSAAVYGNLHDGPIGDDAATAPFSPYGAHKFAMEAICRGWAGSFGMNIVAIRLFSVFGPGLKKQLLWDLCGRLVREPDRIVLGGTGDEVRDWTHVDDVVRALIVTAPLASTAMPVINAGSGVGHTVRSVAEEVLHMFGRCPSALAFSGECRPGDPFSLVAAPDMLRSMDFAWTIDLKSGIADYVRWYQSRGKS